MTMPFASSADLAHKTRSFEELAEGVYALTAEGDPNVGAVEGEDLAVCFEAMATPPPASGRRCCASVPTCRSATWSCPTTTRSGCWARRRSART